MTSGTLDHFRGAMLGHAYALAWRQRRADANDAHRMRLFVRLQSQHVNPEARRQLLAGLTEQEAKA